MIQALALHAANLLLTQLLKSDPVTMHNIQSSLAGKSFRVVLHRPNLALDVYFDSDGSVQIEPTAPKTQSDTLGPFDQPSTQSGGVNEWALMPADCTLEVNTLTDAFELIKSPTTHAKVTGDMAVLQRIKDVLGGLNVSVGERLSPYIGASLAGQIDRLIGSLKRAGAKGAKHSQSEVQQLVNAADGPLATQSELTQHQDQLRSLRLGVERLEARLKQLEAQAEQHSD